MGYPIKIRFYMFLECSDVSTYYNTRPAIIFDGILIQTMAIETF